MGAITLVIAAVVDLVLGIAFLFAPIETAEICGLGGVANPALPLQLLGAGFLGFSLLNWFGRTSPAGGLYSRPLVAGNFAFHLVSALPILRACLVVTFRPTLWVLFGIHALLAALFLRLMLVPRAAAR
jgi:hypothetical protein